MARSENPFRPTFWLGSVDPRPFALFRIGLGVSILHDLADYSRDLRAFLTDDGILPRSVPRDWWAWGIFDLVGSMPAVTAVYLLGCLAVLAFTLGWQTRVATIASWFFLSSLHHRNYTVTDGGDDLTRILLFWAMFCNLGTAWSLDARRRATRVVDMPAFVPRLLQLHVAVLYFCTGRLKFREGWFNRDAIYQALQLDGFVRPLGGLLARSAELCSVATRAILLMEMAFIFLAFAPVWRKPTRALAIAVGVAIQGGILLTMRVGIFTEVMLWVLAMWIQPEWIDGAESWLRKRKGIPALDHRPLRAVQPGRLAYPFYALLGLQFVITIWGQFAGRRFPLPRIVGDEKRLLGIVQPMAMFAEVHAAPNWSAPGKLTDGTDVEVLSVVAPGMRPRQPGIVFSRWYKFLFKEQEFPYRFPELSAYFCRVYNQRATGPRLASFRLLNALTPPRDSTGRAAPVQHLALWNQTCDQPAAGSAQRPTP